jgi:uncharacterized protein
MQQQISLKVLPEEAADSNTLQQLIAKSVGKPVAAVTGFYYLKKSIDARGKTVWVNITLQAFIDEPFIARKTQPFTFKDISKAEKKIIIVGAGPAGLFAALQLIELGIQPIIVERGKDVRTRRRDLAALK